MTGTGFVILGGPGAEVWQLSPTFRISFTSLLALILCSINHSAVRLCRKNVHKKNVATPFEATTSFLRLEPITQWEYLTRKPPEDILCINRHSQGETDHVPLSLNQYAVSSKLAMSNCLILPPSYPQTCTNINQTLFSGSKRMPFCTTDCHTRCQGKYIVWFKSITLLFTQLSVKVYIPYTSLQSCRLIRALNWSIIALWNFVLIKRSKCCIKFSKTIPRISITLIALDTEGIQLKNTSV